MSEIRFRETMPIVFSIVDFPPSGLYYSPFGRTTMFQMSYGGPWVAFVPTGRLTCVWENMFGIARLQSKARKGQQVSHSGVLLRG